MYKRIKKRKNIKSRILLINLKLLLLSLFLNICISHLLTLIVIKKIIKNFKLVITQKSY